MKVLSTPINSNQTPEFYQLTHGIDIDPLLYQEEILVQSAWIDGLLDSGHLTTQEAQKVHFHLKDIESKISKGEFHWIIEDEDIHMNIERALTEAVGDLGKKIHLGRSRNDLIATTLKLFIANKYQKMIPSIVNISKSFLELSVRDIEIIMPSYTHSQAAQPIRLSHIWNFHALNFIQDVQRIQYRRENTLKLLPLGSSAITGTHLNVDLSMISSKLGFQSPPLNSLHGVCDRDFMIEMAQSLSLIGLHVSRLCEDVIFLSSSPVGIIKLPPDWSSGSSIMPNKRNPDFFEILRAKAKSLLSLPQEVILINTGFSSGYVSDMHEQKKLLIPNLFNTLHFLNILPKAILSLTPDPERAKKMLLSGHILATDMSHEWVKKGLPFRDAYKNVAKMILESELKDEQIGTHHLSFEQAVENRNNFGGTSKSQVLKTTGELQKLIF